MPTKPNQKDNDKLTKKIVNQYIKQPKKTNISLGRNPGTTKIYRKPGVKRPR